jgi:hypothetical protein
LTEGLSQLKFELQKYNTAIAVVQEVRWNGEGITDRGYFTMLYSRSTDKYTSDTGSISVANLKAETWVRITTKYFNRVHGR